MFHAKVIGYGHYVPEKVLTNEMLEGMVDTSDEWITNMTGIKERRIAEEGEYTGDLAYEAGRRAVERAGIAPEELDMILVASVTPDRTTPSMSCEVQARLGAVKAAAMDINSACSGFLFGISVANEYIKNGTFKNILIIGADCLSRVTDYEDRSTCVLFGDGAGALVLSATEEETGVLSTVIGSDGAGGGVLTLPMLKVTQEDKEKRIGSKMPTIYMDGHEVFKFAVRVLVSCSKEVVKKAGLTMDDIDCLIPHQANIRIVDSAVKRLKFDRSRVFVDLQKYGNTSAASVPLAVSEALEQGFVKPGDIAVLTAFGGGLSWGGAVIRF